MLITRLREDPTARKRYVKFANADGLADLLEGIQGREATSHRAGMTSEGSEHAIVLHEAEELGLLHGRIEALGRQPLQPGTWRRLLYSARSLLPKDESLRVPMPGSVDLVRLMASPQGQLLRATLVAFSTSIHASGASWLFSSAPAVLDLFYSLASYTSPVVRPPYPSQAELQQRLAASAPLEALLVVATLQQWDGVVADQFVHGQLLSNLDQRALQEIRDLLDEGQVLMDARREMDYSSYDDAYATWTSRAEDFLSQRDKLASAASLGLTDALTELDSMYGRIEPPGDPDVPDPSDWTDTDSDYWTIERIFEDL